MGADMTTHPTKGDRFPARFWARHEQRRPLVRGYHEVVIALEGEVEITLKDGRVLCAEHGDVMDTSKDSSGYWKDLAVSRGCGRW